MAKPYDSATSSEGTASNVSIASEDEGRNGEEANHDEEIDEEELEAVARTASPDEDEAKNDSGDEDAKDDDGDEYGEEVSSDCLARWNLMATNVVVRSDFYFLCSSTFYHEIGNFRFGGLVFGANTIDSLSPFSPVLMCFPVVYNCFFF